MKLTIRTDNEMEQRVEWWRMWGMHTGWCIQGGDGVQPLGRHDIDVDVNDDIGDWR